MATLSNNALAVIALANEYCQAIELAASTPPADFVHKMTRLLPRLYICVCDLTDGTEHDDPEYGMDTAHLDENYYNQVRDDIAALLGEYDAYLETFHEDMQYSDTPIAATVSEGLADIFQVLFNFVEDIKDTDADQQLASLATLRQDFDDYWSQTLCNTLRPLNELRGNNFSDEEDF